MREYKLTSPFLTITFDDRPDYFRAVFVAWMVFWSTVSVGVLYLYAVVFPSVVGFETALLAGVGVIALTVGGSDD